MFLDNFSRSNIFFPGNGNSFIVLELIYLLNHLPTYLLTYLLTYIYVYNHLSLLYKEELNTCIMNRDEEILIRACIF